MNNDVDKIRKKLRKDFDDMIDNMDDSDIPIHERRAKDKKRRDIGSGNESSGGDSNPGDIPDMR